jgi:hypothetical protein
MLLAAEAGRFDVVAKLADELRALRYDAANVADITSARSKTPRH